MLKLAEPEVEQEGCYKALVWVIVASEGGNRREGDKEAFR